MALRDLIERSFLSMGERLWFIREKMLYRHDYASFLDFVKELNIGNSMASKLMRIYEVFVVKFKFPQPVLAVLPWTSLYELSRLVRNKEEAEEMLGEMPFLKAAELRMRVYELQSGHPCDHDLYEISFRMCHKCPLSERIK